MSSYNHALFSLNDKSEKSSYRVRVAINDECEVKQILAGEFYSLMMISKMESLIYVSEMQENDKRFTLS